MEVVRDLLDKQLIDSEGRELGRVDGILLEYAGGGPPRLSSVLIGASVLAERVHPALARVVAAIERLIGLSGRRPVRIDVSYLKPVGHDIAIGQASARMDAAALEYELRVWLMKVPGVR
jgi:sporulation protein YlmC with PRC-barrel domain